jgi:F-type H+-transporting ATPase subunit epsilon
MANTLTVNISTPERIFMEREGVKMISAMGVDGQFAILPGHIAFLTKINAGVMKIRTENEELEFATGPGFFQVNENVVTVVTDDAIGKEEIDRKKAEEARARAHQQLEKRLEGTDFQKVEAELRRSLLELKLLDHIGK